MSEGVDHTLTTAVVDPFTVDEVTGALSAMAPHRTAGIASFPVDFYQAAQDLLLYAVIVWWFTFFG